MFLTRLPVGGYHAGASPGELTEATRWFPFVGLLVGLLLSLLWWLLTPWLPATVAVVLILVASVLLTGAFHEDGLADVADSAGAFERDARMAIMRDSRLGTYGALALILLMLGKWSILLSLAELQVGHVAAGLVLAHVMSRWSSVYLMATIRYARAEAANRVIAEGVDRRRLIEAGVVAVPGILFGVLLAGQPTLILVGPIAWCIAWLMGRYFHHAFDGITGDCLGAANQMVESGCLLTVLLVLQHAH